MKTIKNTVKKRLYDTIISSKTYFKISVYFYIFINCINPLKDQTICSFFKLKKKKR